MKKYGFSTNPEKNHNCFRLRRSVSKRRFSDWELPLFKAQNDSDQVYFMVGMDQPQKRKKGNESSEQDQAPKKRKCLQKYKDLYTIELNRQRSTTKVEVMMCELIAELNLPLSSADTYSTKHLN